MKYKVENTSNRFNIAMQLYAAEDIHNIFIWSEEQTMNIGKLNFCSSPCAGLTAENLGSSQLASLP